MEDSNCKLLRRLLSQIERIFMLTRLEVVTAEVVEAARESLKIE